MKYVGHLAHVVVGLGDGEALGALAALGGAPVERVRGTRRRNPTIAVRMWSRSTTLYEVSPSAANSMPAGYLRYLLPPWQATRRPTCCWRRSTASRGRCRRGSRSSTWCSSPSTRSASAARGSSTPRGASSPTTTQADCRVAFLVGGTADEAREFLGPLGHRHPHVRRPRPGRRPRLRAADAARDRPPRRRRHDRQRRRGLGPARVADAQRATVADRRLARPRDPRPRDPGPVRRAKPPPPPDVARWMPPRVMASTSRARSTSASLISPARGRPRGASCPRPSTA